MGKLKDTGRTTLDERYIYQQSPLPFVVYRISFVVYRVSFAHFKNSNNPPGKKK
jgi:hypothetical protein